jgi:hypothetical protein
MERESNKSETHYHIHWANASLDWKPFGTKEEAMKLAGQIKRRDEAFTIVERNDQCERCRAFKSKPMQIENPSLKNGHFPRLLQRSA